MTKKVPPGGQKMNYTKNRPREVDQRAMPIGKMVSLLILPFGNPKSAKGWHPYLGKLTFINYIPAFICHFSLSFIISTKILQSIFFSCPKNEGFFDENGGICFFS